MAAMFARVVEAHAALISPPDREADAEYVCNAAICSLTAFIFCAVVDRLIARRFKRSYMALHVVVNTIITALTLPGAMRALISPSTSSVIAPGRESPNALYMCWVYALHIYHPIAYKTGIMDWIHHVPVYIINTITFSVRTGDAILLQAVILTGIPGGIDYLLQVLEGEGLLNRPSYKEYCSKINVWMRAPLGVVSSYVCFLGLYTEWEHATPWTRCVLFLLALHAFWNPPFFGRQAIEANLLDAINAHRLSGAPGKEGLKLPKVRALCGKVPNGPTPDSVPPAKLGEPYPIDPTCAGKPASASSISPTFAGATFESMKTK